MTPSPIYIPVPVNKGAPGQKIFVLRNPYAQPIHVILEIFEEDRSQKGGHPSAKMACAIERVSQLELPHSDSSKPCKTEAVLYYIFRYQ